MIAKVRHQLFLPKPLSDRLEALAAKPGASKSAILADAVAAWLDRCGGSELDDRFGLRLDRLSAGLTDAGFAVRPSSGTYAEKLTAELVISPTPTCFAAVSPRPAPPKLGGSRGGRVAQAGNTHPPPELIGPPDRTPELAYYYPTSTLVTSRDIITLWVARMVIAGLYNLGEVPFREVYITPKVLDGFGETMSKMKMLSTSRWRSPRTTVPMSPVRTPRCTARTTARVVVACPTHRTRPPRYPSTTATTTAPRDRSRRCRWAYPASRQLSIACLAPLRQAPRLSIACLAPL